MSHGADSATGSATVRAGRFVILRSPRVSCRRVRSVDRRSRPDTVRLALIKIQPIYSGDVAAAVGRTAVGTPVNGVVEVAGPDTFRLDELIRKALADEDDPRTVVADPHAPYFGAELQETTLLPGADAHLAKTRFADWTAQR